MTELVANTTDAAQEKHVPVITVEGDKVSVKVGSVPHPITEEHRIVWIYLQTERANSSTAWIRRTKRKPASRSAMKIRSCAAFEYCNLHGLWKADYK